MATPFDHLEEVEVEEEAAADQAADQVQDRHITQLTNHTVALSTEADPTACFMLTTFHQIIIMPWGTIHHCI